MIKVRRNRANESIEINNGDLVVHRKKNIVGEIEYLNLWSFEVDWSNGSRDYYPTWCAYKYLIYVTGGKIDDR